MSNSDSLMAGKKAFSNKCAAITKRNRKDHCLKDRENRDSTSFCPEGADVASI